MRLAWLLLTTTLWLLPLSARAIDPGDPRFAATYVKASITVEIKGFLRLTKGVPPVLEVHELRAAPSQVWMLDIGQDERLKELLGRLDGKLVVVTGTCGLRTVGIGATVRQPFGLNQTIEKTVQQTAIDFERKVKVAAVKEAGRD